MRIEAGLRAHALLLAAAAALAAGATAAAELPAAKPAVPAKAAAAKAGKSAKAADNSAERAMLARLKQLYPATTFTSVSKTPMSGVFEVVMGPNIAYVGNDARHFLFGHLFDLRDQVDLTAQRMQGADMAGAQHDDDAVAAANAGKPIDFAQLPLRDAIVQVNGTGARKVAVFTDPQCPYCKQLEADMPQLVDTTVYNFLVPILGPTSREMAQQRWALAMPERALDTDVLDRNLQLARRLGVQATPTLVRADGQLNAGAMPLPELTAWLDAVQKVAQIVPAAP